MSEKIRYLKDELDFSIFNNQFLFFEKGHLMLEGSIEIKDNNGILSNNTLKDGRVIESVWIDETQMVLSLSGQMIQLKKAVRPATFNELLKDYQGNFENMLFDLTVTLQDDNIRISFQGKTFEGKADVIKEGEQYYLINHESLYDGKSLPMGSFDRFTLLNHSLVLFTDDNNPSSGRITLRKI